ncbi:MAG TPA: hypothetical protein VGL51_03710 [Solirubrobacteraceae bacterium]
MSDPLLATPGDHVSDLLPAARAWVQAVDHPHARHLLRTEDWVVEIEPDASERLRIAAVLHDIERAFPDPEATWDSARDWDSAAYNRWHQDRCADIAADWLRRQAAPPELVEGVERLIRVHEEGGWPEADLLQAADSLSFLETLVYLVVGWIESGRATRERGAAKMQNSVDRINPDLERARELAEPMLRDALVAVESAPARAAG